MKKNYRIAEILKVPEGSRPIDTTKIKQVKKANKVQRIVEQKEGLNPQNITPRAKRTAAKNASAINKILAEE